MKSHASIDPVRRTATVPTALLSSRRARVEFHQSGQLASVHVPGDRKRNGRLELGVESSERMEWSAWVQAALETLESIA